MVWQMILSIWHRVGSVLGAVILVCFLAAIALFVVELCIYRRKRRREDR